MLMLWSDHVTCIHTLEPYLLKVLASKRCDLCTMALWLLTFVLPPIWWLVYLQGHTQGNATLFTTPRWRDAQINYLFCVCFVFRASCLLCLLGACITVNCCARRLYQTFSMYIIICFLLYICNWTRWLYNWSAPFTCATLKELRLTTLTLRKKNSTLLNLCFDACLPRLHPLLLTYLLQHSLIYYPPTQSSSMH